MPEQRIDVQETGTRLDRYLAQQLAGWSRAAVQRLIKEGAVDVNGKPARPSQAVASGDVITILLPELTAPDPAAQPEPFALEILYEDEDLLVVNKPAGMVVHPAPGHESGTLVDALLAYRPALAQADRQRPGIVHRLDRDTSGALLVAATPQTLAALQRQFKARRVQKTYLALVYGHLAPPKGAIEAPIGRDPHQRTRMAVLAEGGRYARSEYRLREYLPESSYLEIDLLTGRTHQIRVHLSAIGYPVVGDRVYGPRRQRIASPRQWLHAWRLAFEHPAHQRRIEITAPLPADLEHVLQTLREKAL